MAWQLRLYEGIWSIFLARKGLRHSNFDTTWPNATKLPDHRQQQHNNQTMFERVGAQVARGDCMFRPPLFICCIAKKKDWLGLVVVFLNHTLTISLVKYLK
jgi:hypothetical protein